ncbi:glycoside hydrolase family 10 protein [Pseudoalteromonas sp. SSMSWG5]|uniref:glycoside hydrolase family 10 protein n=1 Tax=Pseudoalteromonas sp. SSMSWG5 TaxID=3139396 RepID=UPI003BAC925B
MYLKILSLLSMCLVLSACSLLSKNETTYTEKQLLGTIYQPQVAREFRAAWVATVANINWPTEPGLAVTEQKRQAIQILDKLQQHNFNTVIFQVRPQADSFYHSSREPWSYYLTGEQGRAPVPFYDPLQFWIEQAHKRGLKIHAWFNPYRAHHPDGGPVSEHSVVTRMPDQVVKLKNSTYWFLPTDQDVVAHTLNTLTELVKNYDLDGIHYDDYFYPYPSYNEGEDFPDALQYQAYVKAGGKLIVADWRREAVNQFVKRLYARVKETKPHVLVGISPFGIYRPNNPDSIRGMDQYEKLYADAKLWLNEGWLDYLTPQLYWPINQYAQSYPLLVNWWQTQNTKQRHLWPGINALRSFDTAGVDEVVNQIMVNRGFLASPGTVFWNVAALDGSRLMSDALAKGVFQHQALIPQTPWIDMPAVEPFKVSYERSANHIELSWQHVNEPQVTQSLVYFKYGDDWHYQLYANNKHTLKVATEKEQQTLTTIKVIAVDRLGNQSDAVQLEF